MVLFAEIKFFASKPKPNASAGKSWVFFPPLLLLARSNDWGKPTASSLSADGFPLTVGPNFQPSDGDATVISILRQLADGP